MPLRVMPSSSKAPHNSADLGESWANVSADSDSPTDVEHDGPRRKVAFSNGAATKQRQRSARETSSVMISHMQSPQSRPFDDSGFIMPSLQHGQASSSGAQRSATNPTPRKSHKAAPKRQSNPPHRNAHNAAGALSFVWSQLVLPFLGYTLSTIKTAACYAKPLIAFALLVYLVFGLLIAARNGVSASIHAALSPLCSLPFPGASFLTLPFCHYQTKNSSAYAPPVAFDQLVTAQAAFEDVLKTSAGGASLPLDMKRSESSIRDLRHVVEYSSLPSRHELVLEFQGFIETARQASSDLTRYNSRIGRAVDRILTTNRWTLQVLDGIAETDANRGRVVRFVQDKLNPFAALSPSRSVTQNVLFDQYIRHTSAIEEQIASLILEAQALLQILQNMDDRLDLIAGITQRDGVHISENRDALFAQLWTRLGGNRQQSNKYTQQLTLLDDVAKYRKLAWAHVSGTVLKLQAIAANLEDLRERVARPEIVGYREELPLEMHVREIVMGVQRLEAVRDQGRVIEGEWIRGTLDKAEFLGLEGPPTGI